MGSAGIKSREAYTITWRFDSGSAGAEGHDGWRMLNFRFEIDGVFRMNAREDKVELIPDA